MKAKYKEKIRLILINNKLPLGEKITAVNDVIDEIAAEFDDLHKGLVEHCQEARNIQYLGA